MLFLSYFLLLFMFLLNLILKIIFVLIQCNFFLLILLESRCLVLLTIFIYAVVSII